MHLGSFVMVFIAAKFADVDRRLVLRFGSLWAGFIWGVKLFLNSARSVFIVDGLHGLASTTISIPFDALSYDKANKEGLVEYIIFREVTIQVGDELEIFPGCRKRNAEDCATKFNNIVNFRGEPFIPGQDDLLKVPNAQ